MGIPRMEEERLWSMRRMDGIPTALVACLCVAGLLGCQEVALVAPRHCQWDPGYLDIVEAAPPDFQWTKEITYAIGGRFGKDGFWQLLELVRTNASRAEHVIIAEHLPDSGGRGYAWILLVKAQDGWRLHTYQDSYWTTLRGRAFPGTDQPPEEGLSYPIWDAQPSQTAAEDLMRVMAEADVFATDPPVMVWEHQLAYSVWVLHVYDAHAARSVTAAIVQPLLSAPVISGAEPLSLVKTAGAPYYGEFIPASTRIMSAADLDRCREIFAKSYAVRLGIHGLLRMVRRHWPKEATTPAPDAGADGAADEESATQQAESGEGVGR